MGRGPLWGFDFDSVVGDLSEILERVAREEFGVQISREEFTDFRLEKCLPFNEEFILAWISRALEPRWTRRMRPYPGAAEVLTELSEIQPLWFVTARPDPGPVREWLEANLQDVPRQRIWVHAVGPFGSKVDILHEEGITHFVEDRLETCEAVYRKGIIPVVFDQPWNRGKHSFPSVQGWDDLRGLIFGERKPLFG